MSVCGALKNNIKWPVHAVHERGDQRAFSSRVFIEAKASKIKKERISIEVVILFVASATHAWVASEDEKVKEKKTRQSSIQFSTSFLFDLSHFSFCIYIPTTYAALNNIVFSSLITIFHIHIINICVALPTTVAFNIIFISC